jgi:hypothetical protein
MNWVAAVLLGVLLGLLVQAVRVAWVMWTTRITTLGDYLVALILWIDDRKEKRKWKMPNCSANSKEKLQERERVIREAVEKATETRPPSPS